jgi:hypothetical protein
MLETLKIVRGRVRVRSHYAQISLCLDECIQLFLLFYFYFWDKCKISLCG